ncbi:MAG TPA: sugar phosphate isomerase/epimerase [Candidatus Limnocylindrales bacterium]|jgi:sugar phosphate isomerase/epimerase|nr:sugar phosphate isomerase/epimerase [Candidatus Limnocylindrales bacterium]
MRSSQIGLQLYTVREQTASDMIGTLRRVAEIGYGAVEFAGWGNTTPRDILHVLEAEGVTAIGAHVALVDLETRPMQVLAECEIVGCRWVVVPWVPDSWRATSADASRLAARLNDLGELCQAEGMRLAYHNHEAEFGRLEEGTVWETLIAETWPDLVDLELDAYWASVAGQDPEIVLRQSMDRVRLMHVKDRAPGLEMRDTPVGQGTLPWKPIIEEAEISGVEWFIVEQDEPADALKDIETSLFNLRRIAGLPAD